MSLELQVKFIKEVVKFHAHCYKSIQEKQVRAKRR